MSETTEAVETTAPEPVDAATEAPAPETAETTAAAEQGQEASQDAAKTEAPKPKHSDRRYARLTAQLDAALRRAEAAEALAKVQTTDGQPATLTEAEIERRAAELTAQREFQRGLDTMIETGRTEFGRTEFDEASRVLHDFGASRNPAFLQALAATPNGHKLVTHLAEETDALEMLLTKAPLAMAAEIGRMAAKLDTPKQVDVKAHTRTVSAAPRPPAPVTAAASVPAPNLYDPALANDPRAFAAALRKTYGPKFGTGAR